MEKTKSPVLGTARWLVETTARLAAERGWAERSPQEVYLLILVVAREDARHILRQKVHALRNDLNHLDKILKVESPLLNTLGELQMRPAAVEAAVGAFAAADKALREYLKTFPATAS